MNDLVMIPGLGSDRAVWRRTIDALGARASCTVGDTLQDDTLAGMARRILAAAPARFVLAGLSMGGMVALEMLRLAPDRIAALALVDSNGFPDSEAQADQRRRSLQALATGAVDIRKASAAGLAILVHPQASADVRDAIVEMGSRVGVETYARQLKAVLERPDQSALLGAVAVPALVVSGAEDLMIPPATAQAMAAAIPGAELRLLPDCGHLPPIEAPAAMADLLAALLLKAA